MHFDWTEFLTLAERLQSAPNSPGPPEAALRSAASRAYYAAFHRALNFACKEGFQPSFQASDHKEVQDHFSSHKPSDRIRRKIARELQRLWDQRRQADYDAVLKKKPTSLADHAIGMARHVLEYLDSLVDD
jgi:uncharacterized protein (UPF0332 family)